MQPSQTEPHGCACSQPRLRHPSSTGGLQSGRAHASAATSSGLIVLHAQARSGSHIIIFHQLFKKPTSGLPLGWESRAQGVPAAAAVSVTMKALVSRHSACPAFVAVRTAAPRPLAALPAPQRGARPSAQQPCTHQRRVESHRNVKAASTASNGTAAAGDMVYIPVSELQELCSQSLAALGYSPDEVKTLSEVRGAIRSVPATTLQPSPARRAPASAAPVLPCRPVRAQTVAAPYTHATWRSRR